MKTRKQKERSMPAAHESEGDKKQRKAYAVYGDKVPICINAKCIMRKQAACFGFEGCPGFRAKG
jgi:hypothetical protein